MKARTAALAAAIALTLVVVAVVKTAPTRQPQKLSPEQVAELEGKERSGRINLRERARLAKAKGKQQLVVPAVATNYLGMPASPEALHRTLHGYTVVVVQLTERKSYMPDEGVIRTWNKFRVVETLHRAPPRPSYVTRPEVPREFLPLGEDEIVVHSEGGTVDLDGVEVTQHDASLPTFRKAHKYLLALSLDPSTRVGEIEMGPHSLLPLNPDGTLDPRRDRDYLQQVLKTRHGGSFEQLKKNLGGRADSH